MTTFCRIRPDFDIKAFRPQFRKMKALTDCVWNCCGLGPPRD